MTHSLAPQRRAGTPLGTGIATCALHRRPWRKEEERQPDCARPLLHRVRKETSSSSSSPSSSLLLDAGPALLGPLAGLMAPAPRVSELRQAGNNQFRNGQYSQAATLYGRALQLLEATGTGGRGESPQQGLRRIRGMGQEKGRGPWWESRTGDVNPEDKSVLYSNRAACYLKDGNCSLCIQDCSVALDLVPFGIKPLLRRAAAYEALERYQLAYVDYKTVLQVDCTVQAAHDGVNRMTKVLLDAHGLQWRQKLPPIPAVPVSAQRRWESPLGSQEATPKNKSNDAASVTKQVPAAATTEQPNVLKQEGNDCVKKGDYKKAIEKYTESLKLHKLECTTYTNRALCYLNLKQYKEAIQDCSEALKLDPKNVKAFYRRAQAYKELKDYKSSIADVNSLLKIEPKNTAAQKLLKELKLLK
ncbi:mitochondrial import receptor subunit TOM34 isoform X1 [Hemicordylus capensis]|uniref:mitochondrial import receptor subunit TOM34 isoform X1 n=1 Tax=Hemicordylus capensis TaxID=884348 RepID=UPI0023048597|nr:mitochondrial import receptor subunit TOM34 isoform X1 [Hemicordylus capensis]